MTYTLGFTQVLTSLSTMRLTAVERITSTGLMMTVLTIRTVGLGATRKPTAVDLFSLMANVGSNVTPVLIMSSLEMT